MTHTYLSGDRYTYLNRAPYFWVKLHDDITKNARVTVTPHLGTVHTDQSLTLKLRPGYATEDSDTK